MAALILANFPLFALMAASGIAPALFWLWFWLKEDARRPEPKRMIIRVFALGALSVILASVLERALVAPSDLLGGKGIVGVVLLLSLIEEAVKYGAAYLGAFRSPYFDEPVDAMIYLITAALGFAAVENILFMASSLGDPSGSWDFLLTGSFRFVGASIVHIVASSLVGGMLGLAFYESRWRRTGAIALGLTLAVALHALFNYFIIKSEGGQILHIFVALWLAALLVILFFEKVKNTVARRKAALLEITNVAITTSITYE